jgi:hypothetical protein
MSHESKHRLRVNSQWISCVAIARHVFVLRIKMAVVPRPERSEEGS